ncbi:MAG: metallophosphoesterase [Flavobacteriaceae bacterium]|nr:metallophosphoesterase [Flavobacteriaceae bacterium]
MTSQKSLFFLLILFFLGSCATYGPQYKYSATTSSFPENREVKHTFYLIGDAGNSEQGGTSNALLAFKEALDKASENSTAIFLGDNIYEKGLPKESSPEYPLAKHRIQVQADVTKDFKGKSIFIPGNHDWYSGIKGLKRQEKFIEEQLGKNTFLPEDGCPIDKVHISDDIELILVDSHWYIKNWNKEPTINDDCDIKTRQNFLNEFSSLIKKARTKTTIVAIHHPMYTNGSHGGQFTLGSHLTPIPVLGTLKNVIRKTSGVSHADLQNARYNELKQRLVTLAQANKKVIFVSGHDHNLQYIIEDNLHQIVSGSGSKVKAARNIGGGQFTYATPGYATLTVFKDGSSDVSFYSADDKKVVFESNVFPANQKKVFTTYPKSFPNSELASIYTEEETKASGTKKFLWGDRYRKYYSTAVNAPTVDLDTLFGGLTPVRKGGGNQSKSLRLKDKNGAQYMMRALRKQATQYLQAIVFKDQFIEGQFDNTAAEKLLLDVFTGAHPYAPFAVGDLADAVGVYHTKPVLYFVPKQNALGYFNEEFGNELYMIEEHTSEGHSDKPYFGFQDKLESTDDMMKKLHKDEDIIIDEEAYIRARLFDMLIGDWDRHQDQWRWIEFKENGKKVFRPMPRDRDQAFSIMADGFLLGAAVKLIPTSRLLRKYSDDLEDVKGVNLEPYPLDMELITQSEKGVWDAQVKVLQSGLTDAVIEKAFLNFPLEVRDETVETIKKTLKARRTNLQKISDRYFDVINRFAVIKGTDKDDWFDIERLANGKTKVTAYRIKGGEKADKFHERIYAHNQTKEIWIYALDDDDVFHVFGNNADKEIKVRLVGGQNNDTYDITNGKRITFYDYKSKKNTVKTSKGKKKLSDNYNTNVYDYKKLRNNLTQIVPSIGANPDDGLKIGASATLTSFGFERNPFTSRHQFSAAYYFATSGYELNYNGEFANLFTNVNFGIDLQFNSPNYAANFFGFGNSTPNPEAEDDDGLDVDLDYNRVKIRTFKAMPALIWRGQQGARFKAGIFYESNEVDNTTGRFISQPNTVPNSVFDMQDFYGAEMEYYFENKDNESFPTLGFQFGVQAGYKNNVDTEKGFGYLIPELGIDYKLIPSGQLVLATDVRAHLNLGDDFEFYQAATLGARTGLRGYRHERFSGKTSFVQSTDVRWVFNNMKTGVVPLRIGIYGGFDYGKVWIDDSLVNNPAQNNQNVWNTSIGGGFFLNMAKMMTLNVSAFNSDDNLRLAFQLGFGF